ncbi:sulfite exporter TauE/SafE family protein [Herbaspirillum sp. AP02]|uniref:sulfite exporter TauE/SafE family protein n=1 Tax=unclassified Herbaspirillum TaxID=2624150 RepID=UPI0018CA3029|nr:sulfite exporter TauE/SafE family protein [Herbaspirillum sp. AP02]MBG7618134.1 sulfite exporter TauE/SafE family protein [Herbaspirillum sp. AP02]
MSMSLLLGALVGCIMGLTGAGGGILAIPLLVFGLHLSVPQAGPIGLLAVGMASAMGAVIGLRAGIVRYRAALLVAAVGIALTPLGTWLAHQLDTRYLTLLFAIVMVWVAVKGMRDARRSKTNAVTVSDDCPCLRDKSGRFLWTPRCASRLAVMGGMAGVLSGLLGVGGGFVIVPVLQRVTDLAMQSVVSTSLAVIALISLVSVGTSMVNGHFDLNIGLPFSAGAIAGMLLGGKLSMRWHPAHLKLVFSIVCMVVSVGLIIKSLY